MPHVAAKTDSNALKLKIDASYTCIYVSGVAQSYCPALTVHVQGMDPQRAGSKGKNLCATRELHPPQSY